MERVGPTPGLNNARGNNNVTVALPVHFADQLPAAHSRAGVTNCRAGSPNGAAVQTRGSHPKV